MALLKFNLFLFVLALGVFLSSSPVLADENEDNVLRGLNSYRQARNLPVLTRNDKAGCVADEIADDLDGQNCTVATNGANIAGSDPTQLPNFSDYLRKCNVNNASVADGVIMPVCVPRLDQERVLNNYTQTRYARNLNDSRFTGAGVGSQDDWMVVVLTTNSRTGSFAASAAYSLLISHVCLVSLFLGLLFVVW